MAESKSLKFSFVLDDQSFARVKRALGELTTEAQKFAKAMQDANSGLFSGANVGKPPSAARTHGLNRGGGGGTVNLGGGTNLGGAILKDVDAFKKLAQSGTQTAKMMRDAVGASIRDQIRDIEKLDKQIKLLQDRYSGLKTDAQKANAAQAMIQLTSQRGAAAGNLQQMFDAGGTGLFGGRGPFNTVGAGYGQATMGTPLYTGWKGGSVGLTTDLTGGLGPKGMASAAMDSLLGPGLAGMIARSVGMAIAGGMKIISTSVDADRMGMDLKGQHGRAMAPFIQRLKSRNTEDQDVSNYLAQDDKSAFLEALRSVEGSDANAQRWIKGTLNTMGGNLTGSQLTDLARKSMSAEDYNKLLESGRQQAGWQLGMGRAREYAAETRDSRLQASRILGKGFFLPSNGGDTFTPWASNLHRKGFSQGEALSAYIQSRQGAGSGAYSGAIMAATAGGWSGYGDLLMSAARMGNAGAATAALGGYVDPKTKRILAPNTAAGIHLGQGVIGSGFDARGTVDLSAVFGSFQGGYGSRMGKGGEYGDPAKQFHAVGQFLAGLQAGDAVVSGRTSGYQTGMNILGAIGTAPGMSAYTQDYLATGMSYKQMLAGASGQLTETARLSGLTPEMMRKQLGSSASAALGMWVDEGGLDQRSRAMRRYQESGLSPEEFAKRASIDEVKSLGATLGLMNPDMGEEGGIGYMMSLKGLGYRGAKGRAPGAGRTDDLETTTRDSEARAMLESSEAISDNLGRMITSIAVQNATAKSMSESLQRLDGGVETIIKLISTVAKLSDSDLQKIRESAVAKAIASAPNAYDAAKAAFDWW